MIKTLTAISARGIEINFVSTPLEAAFIAVENVIPSGGRYISYAIDYAI